MATSQHGEGAHAPDSCEYVRSTYGVPARVGGRVKIGFVIGPFDKMSVAQTGVIKGADHHLFVLMDGEKKPRRFHPTWLITYLNDDGTVAARYGDD